MKDQQYVFLMIYWCGKILYWSYYVTWTHYLVRLICNFTFSFSWYVILPNSYISKWKYILEDLSRLPNAYTVVVYEYIYLSTSIYKHEQILTFEILTGKNSGGSISTRGFIRQCSLYKLVNIEMVQVSLCNAVHWSKGMVHFSIMLFFPSKLLVDEDPLEMSKTAPSLISFGTGSCSAVVPPSKRTMRSLSCTIWE